MKHNVQLNVRISPDLLDRLRCNAGARGISAYVRAAITAALNNGKAQ